MADRGVLQALAWAYHAGLYAWPIDERGVVRVARGYLEHGPLASADAIATVVARFVLGKRGVIFGELDVMREVEDYGFRYMPQGAWSAHALAANLTGTALCS